MGHKVMQVSGDATRSAARASRTAPSRCRRAITAICSTDRTYTPSRNGGSEPIAIRNGDRTGSKLGRLIVNWAAG